MYTAPASLVMARFIRLSFNGAASCSENRQQVMISGRPPFAAKLVKIQIVVADDEFNVHVRQLRLNIGRIVFVQAGAPQIHLNSLSVFLLLCSFRIFSLHPVSRDSPITSAASMENRRRNVFVFIRSFSSHFLDSHRFAVGCFCLLIIHHRPQECAL